MTAATKEGTYQLEVDASRATEKLGTYKAAFQIKDRPVEFYDAALDAGNLRSIATQTGGRYYPLDKIADIPEDAVYVDTENFLRRAKGTLGCSDPVHDVVCAARRRVGLEEEEGTGMKQRLYLCLALLMLPLFPKAGWADSSALIIQGVAGSDDHEKKFTKWGTGTRDALVAGPRVRQGSRHPAVRGWNPESRD